MSGPTTGAGASAPAPAVAERGWPTPGSKGADAARRPLPAVGERVALVAFHPHDLYTQLEPGDQGTVKRVSLDTIDVAWDNGSRLMLLTDVDRWEVVG